MNKSTILFFVMSVVLITGCSKKIPEIDTGGANVDSGYDSSDAISNDSQIDSMASMSDSASFASQEERIVAIQNEVQTVYFGTDSYRLSGNEMQKVDQNANIFNGDLANDLSIKIEGNCDEWGTDEYNYALGLKRAKSVKDTLSSLGVDESRMALISYGESKPICAEHNAGCWQQNRRVDFKLLP